MTANAALQSRAAWRPVTSQAAGLIQQGATGDRRASLETPVSEPPPPAAPPGGCWGLFLEEGGGTLFCFSGIG